VVKLRQPARISAELVEDLNLRSFVRPATNWCDFYFIDRRRLARELRRLPKLRAAADARFRADLDNIAYQRRTYAMEYYWAVDGSLISPADLLRIKELVDQALVRSISASR